MCHSMHRKFHDSNVWNVVDDPYLSSQSRKDCERCGAETGDDWMAVQHDRQDTSYWTERLRD